MLMILSDFGRLYVGDYWKNGLQTPKIVLSKSRNFLANGKPLDPFVEDIESNIPMLVSNIKHIKPLNYYVNPFGMARKKIPELEKEKQKQIIKEIKELYQLKRI